MRISKKKSIRISRFHYFLFDFDFPSVPSQPCQSLKIHYDYLYRNYLLFSLFHMLFWQLLLMAQSDYQFRLELHESINIISRVYVGFKFQFFKLKTIANRVLHFLVFKKIFFHHSLIVDMIANNSTDIEQGCDRVN